MRALVALAVPVLLACGGSAWGLTGHERNLHAPCWRGTFATLAFGPFHGWRIVHEDLGPAYFRVHARGVQWPGGTLGYLHNDAGVCTTAEAEAYGAAHPAPREP